MLPDYPKLKERLMGVFLERMRRVEMMRLGFLGGMQETLIQEGRRSSLHRDDGSSQDIEMKSIHVSEPLNVDYRTLEELDVADIIRFFDRVAMALADAKGKHSWRSYPASWRRSGTSKPSKNPITRSCSWPRKDGNRFRRQPALDASFACNPIDGPLIQEGLKHIFETPELKRRYRAIIDQKRERHRDREAARKLVE